MGSSGYGFGDNLGLDKWIKYRGGFGAGLVSCVSARVRTADMSACDM